MGVLNILDFLPETELQFRSDDFPKVNLLFGDHQFEQSQLQAGIDGVRRRSAWFQDFQGDGLSGKLLATNLGGKGWNGEVTGLAWRDNKVVGDGGADLSVDVAKLAGRADVPDLEIGNVRRRRWVLRRAAGEGQRKRRGLSQ